MRFERLLSTNVASGGGLFLFLELLLGRCDNPYGGEEGDMSGEEVFVICS